MSENQPIATDGSGPMEPAGEVSALAAQSTNVDSEYFAALERTANDSAQSNYEVRLAAIRDLGHSDDPRAVPVLLRLWERLWRYADYNEPIRGALDELATEQMLEAWVETLADRDLRTSVLPFLGRLRDPRAVPPLLKLLEDSSCNCHRQIVTALGEIGDRRAVEPLLRLMESPRVRNEDTGGISITGEAALALGKLGDPRAVPAVGAVLKHRLANYRADAARALASFNDLTVIPQLIEVLSGDESTWVQSQALQSLTKLGWQPTTEGEKHLALLIGEQWDELRRCGPAVVDALLDGLNSSLGKNCAALGKLGDCRAVPALVDLVTSLGEAAEAALENLLPDPPNTIALEINFKADPKRVEREFSKCAAQLRTRSLCWMMREVKDKFKDVQVWPEIMRDEYGIAYENAHGRPTWQSVVDVDYSGVRALAREELLSRGRQRLKASEKLGWDHIQIACTQCGACYRLKREAMGKRARCAKCQNLFQVEKRN